ncbi:MAG: sigma 54-interacting transcriptional regulator [Myxococcales bacterium]|nr:sigma 54-interacting transcriptional regulator [Myxococcales bacterium]
MNPETTTCYGRDNELKLLDERLAQVSVSDFGRRVVLIHGASGVGKTHLMQAFRRLVLEKSGWVFEGHCGVENRLPYAPFHEIATAVEAFVPAGDASNLDSERLETQLNYFEVMRRRLHGVASQRPTAFFLHDIDAIDADSLELLRHLLRDWSSQLEPPSAFGRDGFRGLFVLSMKQPQGSSDELFKALCGFPVVEELPLRGLDRRGLASLLQHSDILEKVYQLTGGNPVHVQQIIHTLPENVEDLATRRRRRLAEGDARVLTCIALAQRALSLSEISRLTDEASELAARRLAELQRGHFVRRQMTAGEVRFGLGALAPVDAVLQDATHEQRRDVHLRLLGLLRSQLSFSESIGALDQAIHHALEAEAADDAVEFALRAADLLERSLSFERAILALKRVDTLPIRDDQRVELLRRLSLLYRKVANFEHAAAFAVSFLDSLEDDTQRVETLTFLGEVSSKLGRSDDSERYFERALELVSSTDHLALATIRLGMAEMWFVRGEFSRAEALCELPDLRDDETHESLRLQYQRHAILGKILFQRGRYEESRALFRDALELVSAHGWERESARALHNLGLNELKTGNARGAIALIDESREVCERINEYEGLSLCLLNLGVAYEQCHEFEPAIEVYRRSIALIEKIGRRTSLANALFSLGDICLTLGGYHEARECFQRAEEHTSRHEIQFIGAVVRLARGRLALETGQLRDAFTLLHDALDALKSMQSIDQLARCYLYLAKASATANRFDAAGEWLDRLAALELVEPNESAARARILRARMLAEGEQAEAALGELRQAISILLALRQPEHLVEAYGELALLYERQLDDTQNARECYAQMSRQLDELLQKIPVERRASFTSKPNIARLLTAYQSFVAERTDSIAATATAPVISVLDRGNDAPAPIQTAIIGRSPELLRVLKLANKVARSDSTVLILGESGTGKELLAEAICRDSQRARRPFVRVNAAALSESLLLSELFGHEKGSFTGAVNRKVGKFEQADGGTLFLDEIGDISQKTQVALLRVLQEREFERVGGTKPVKVDVRVILATNRNLEAMVNDGLFRLDLYYRINGLTLYLPALRERAEDIPCLAEHFLSELAQKNGRRVSLDDEAMTLLAAYQWPGNIRELRNVLSSVYFFAEGDRIRAGDLCEYGGLPDMPTLEGRAAALVAGPAELSAEIPDGFDLNEAKRSMEIDYICKALDKQQGNITHAAELLNMKRSRLSQKIKEYEIDVAVYKAAE